VGLNEYPMSLETV
jgi:hypothetical protein